MSLQIRSAQTADLDRLMEIFETARAFMTAHGNPHQWIDGYPQRELIAAEIQAGHCYVCEEVRRIVATFCFIPGPDPTYARIEQGNWLSDSPYAVIHRLASDGSVHGITRACVEWGTAHCGCLRADTHADNTVMQHALEQNGFERCGVIYVANGTPRYAYQWGR